MTERAKAAIRIILREMGSLSYPDIALRGGEGLASPLMEMVQLGEVERIPGEDGSPTLYRLKAR